MRYKYGKYFIKVLMVFVKIIFCLNEPYNIYNNNILYYVINNGMIHQ